MYCRAPIPSAAQRNTPRRFVYSCAPRHRHRLVARAAFVAFLLALAAPFAFGSRSAGTASAAFSPRWAHPSVAAVARAFQPGGARTFLLWTSVPKASRRAGATFACASTAEQVVADQALLTLLNQHRAAVHAPLLRLNTALSRASFDHSCEMFRDQRLQHQSADGASPFSRFAAHGVTYHVAGENIGVASGSNAVADVRVLDARMMSEPLGGRANHHWNIVNPAYTQIGLGVIAAHDQVWLTEDFVG